jgi:hypothetical protein
MRRWLRKRLPTAHEVVYEYRDCFVISYSPNERGYEGVLAIRASANGVTLYISGKELRHVRVETNDAEYIGQMIEFFKKGRFQIW